MPDCSAELATLNAAKAIRDQALMDYAASEGAVALAQIAYDNCLNPGP